MMIMDLSLPISLSLYSEKKKNSYPSLIINSLPILP